MDIWWFLRPDSPHFDGTAYELWRQGVWNRNPRAYTDFKDYMDWEYGIDVVRHLGWKQEYSFPTEV